MADERALALAAIEQAAAMYARDEAEPMPFWLRFLDAAELDSVRGNALAAFPHPSSQDRAEATGMLSSSIEVRDPAMFRLRAFDLTALSRVLLDAGEMDRAIAVGHQAVDLARNIRSGRVIGRLNLLRVALGDCASSPESLALAGRIAEVDRLNPLEGQSFELVREVSLWTGGSLLTSPSTALTGVSNATSARQSSAIVGG